MSDASPTRRNAIHICDEARSASQILINALGPNAGKRRLNYLNIASTCEHLLVSVPILEPTAVNVANVGANLFPNFPALQTLNNTYSSLLNVWRNAYAEILRLKPRRRSAATFRPDTRDEYERELGILKAEIKILTTDLARARAIISNQIPMAVDAASEPSDKNTVVATLLFEWLRDIRELRSTLVPVELTPAGLKISSRARPGMVIMKPELVEIIQRTR